jgi:hypothetical protein
MNESRTLDERCRDALLPEPLVFTLDENGNRVLKTKPLRTIIDVNNLPWGKWLRLDLMAGTVTVKVANERVVYRRVGHDIHDYWVCERVG